jgi:PKD repeat protein
MRVFLIVLVCCAVALAPARAHGADRLKVIVIDGDEAANIVAERIAAEPVIEVQDRQNRRVAGAVVRFVIRKTIRNRLISVFQNGQGEIRTLTDAAGRASAGALQPVEAGSFEIEVDVSYQGQTAKAVIRNTNYPTAADARSAGREPGKSTNPNAQAAGAAGATQAPTAAGSAAVAAAGGGMSKVAVVGLVAGGAAGAGAAVVLSRRASDAPAGTVSAVTASVTSGLQAATPFVFNVQTTGFEAASIAYRWEFGDGAAATDPSPTHVYAAPGSYTVVVTVSDSRQSARSQLAVTVHTLTGAWVSTSLRTTLSLTQSGSTLTGSAAVVSAWDCPLSGSAQSGTPAIVLVQPPGCQSFINGALLVPFEYRLDLSPDGQTLSGTRVVSGGTGLTDPAVFRR